MRYIGEKLGRNAKIYKVAICGLPSTGKSTVLEYFSTITPYTYNSDILIHEFLETDEARLFIKKLCGKELNRQELSHVIFSNRIKQKELENFLHPWLIKTLKKQAEKASKEGALLFVVEVPLLFEIGFDSWFDYIICTVSKKEDALERWTNKGFTEKEYCRRINRFFPIDTYKDNLSLIIDNTNDKQSMKKIILQWANNITKKGE